MMMVAALRSGSFSSRLFTSTRMVAYRGSVGSQRVTRPVVLARASDGGVHRWTPPLSVPTTRKALSGNGLNAAQVTPTRPGVISRAISGLRVE